MVLHLLCEFTPRADVLLFSLCTHALRVEVFGVEVLCIFPVLLKGIQNVLKRLNTIPILLCNCLTGELIETLL